MLLEKLCNKTTIQKHSHSSHTYMQKPSIYIYLHAEVIPPYKLSILHVSHEQGFIHDSSGGGGGEEFCMYGM